MEDSKSGTLEARRAWLLAASLEDIAEEASQIAVPTVVLAGDHENLDSLEQHEREVLSQIPGRILK